ncbi:hypothetical protein FACS1894199_08430 [Bacteroidia bacterium]|nr:hypothetical protein FACS1894199_08430 [Bacteroidia bacterium]
MAVSQQLVAQEAMKIQVRARAQQEAILLRWGATTPVAWKYSNQSGFKVLRYTLVRDSIFLDKVELNVLGGGLVRAKPLEEWMPILETNEQAGVIAQALYGDDFELLGSDNQGLTRVILLSQELEQRFIFSLHAADQDFEMACMAGWGWRDTTVKRGERYLYHVVPATAIDSARIEYGSVFASLSDYRELPVPVGLSAVWGDSSVMLSWDYERLMGYYNSYVVEKSEISEQVVKTFQRLAGPPVTNLNHVEAAHIPRLYFMDLLADNQHTFYYRVRGVSSFGEIGPPSDTVEGKGFRPLQQVPYITRSVINDSGFMDLEWEFDTLGNEQISGFELSLSEKADGDYKTVQQNILPTARITTFGDLYSTNYFKITAVAKEGASTSSFPILMQPLDTMPPAPPIGLTGSIDSLGIVTLSWQQNRELDFLGYLIYRANVEEEEVVPLFYVALKDTCYFDTVQIANLNPFVYYSLQAVDMRYNHSALTSPLCLEKPDVIPPLSPLITDYEVSVDGIEVVWIPSPDADVEAHILYRRDVKRGTAPEVVARVDKGNGLQMAGQSTLDTSVSAATLYEYAVFAVDRGGLVSRPSPMIAVKSSKIDSKNRQINRFDGVLDTVNRLIKVEWSRNLKNVRNYELYRGNQEETVSLWRVLPDWEMEAWDRDLVPGIKYKYTLRALFHGGGNSTIKTLEIQM